MVAQAHRHRVPIIAVAIALLAWFARFPGLPHRPRLAGLLGRLARRLLVIAPLRLARSAVLASMLRGRTRRLCRCGIVRLLLLPWLVPVRLALAIGTRLDGLACTVAVAALGPR